MSYISLYRKYRPSKFSDVVGQDIIVNILKNSIVNNKIGHAYIFSGPRGTGKTTIAKILAKAVNCLNPNGDVCENCENCQTDISKELDIIEMDAASNNGVDEIRDIINNVKYAPSKLKYKIYIIDEVHMLSISAFNALLKTLEEPPSHVIFILATTEFNKIPATVVSRCQKLDFKKINNKTIVDRLKYILKEENKKVSDDVLSLIAQLSDGGLRDSINLLDQVLSINNENIIPDDVYNLIGELTEDQIFNLLENITSGNISEMISSVNKYYEEGKNFSSIVSRLELIVRNILIYNSANNYFEKEYENKLQAFSKIDIDNIYLLATYLFELSNEIKKTNNQKVIVEIYFLKMLLMFSKNSTITKTNVCTNNNNILTQDNAINKKQKNDNIVKEESAVSANIEDKIDKNEKENINENKKIRINNTFCEANKELKQQFISEYTKINDYISSKEYNSISSLLLRATPEVVSTNNILFTFKNAFEVVLFDKNIEDIQKFLKMLYNKKYVVVAVDEKEWNNIKTEYIKNIKSGKKYEYIPEKPIQKKTKSTTLQKSVEDIFGSDYTAI